MVSICNDGSNRTLTDHIDYIDICRGYGIFDGKNSTADYSILSLWLSACGAECESHHGQQLRGVSMLV